MSPIRRAAAVAVLALTGALALAVPASAATTPVVSSTATITGSPEDGCPNPWGRDSFGRTTTITPAGEGTYKVTITDKGSFTTVKGAPSADTSATVKAKVTGTLNGYGEFTVTGTQLGAEALAALNGATIDNGGYANKCSLPADRQTGNWPLRFFAEGAQTSGITGWKWTYETPCEKRVEADGKDPVGNITGKTCAADITVIKATCKDTATHVKVSNPNSNAKLRLVFGDGNPITLAPGKAEGYALTSGSVQVQVWADSGLRFRTSKALNDVTVTYKAPNCPTIPPAAPGGTGGGSGPSLPVTGAGVVTAAGFGLLLVALGIGAVWLTRRRRTTFTT